LCQNPKWWLHHQQHRLFLVPKKRKEKRVEKRNRRVPLGRLDFADVSKERAALVRFTAPPETVEASGVEMESVERESFDQDWVTVDVDKDGEDDGDGKRRWRRGRRREASEDENVLEERFD
jgi:hypothetical protein